MKIKTTYEKDDIIGLITKDLESKGLAPDPGSFVIRPDFPDAGNFEVDVFVSGKSVPAVIDPFTGRRAPADSDPFVTPEPPDLLAEAPSPKDRPVLDISDVVSQGTAAAGSGPFDPARVKGRPLLDGESIEYPGTSRNRSR